MTTDKAIEQLKAIRSDYRDDLRDYPELVKDDVEAIDLAISALERDRWISCEDRLPEEDGEYLFYGDQYFVPDHNGEPDNYKSIKTGYWMFNQSLPDYIGNMFFAHWRPLPEPPKEET